MQGHKMLHSDALKFIFAGNSLFTVLNTKSNNRFTFKVKKNTKSESEMHFVKVLTNPDIYEFTGTCFDKRYKHSQKSRISSDAQSVVVFNWIVNHLQAGTLPEFIDIWHEGRCGKCGRTLTVPQSIEIGIGPECLKSVSDKKIKRQIKLNAILNED